MNYIKLLVYSVRTKGYNLPCIVYSAQRQLHIEHFTAHSVHYTVYSIQYTGLNAAGPQTDSQRQLLAAFCVFAVAPIRNKVESVVCCVLSVVCRVQYLVCSVQYLVFSVQYLVCSVQCLVYSVQYIVCSVQYLVCSVQYLTP